MISALTTTAIKELLRRRTALLLMTLLPLGFYLLRIDSSGQALRFLSLGMGWAVATLALFSHVTARQLDRRLVTAGYSPFAILVGRQVAVTSAGIVLGVAYLSVVAMTLDINRFSAVPALLMTSIVIAAPLGAVVSLVLPRELEGALALLCIMSLQMLADPEGAFAKVLPFWSSRQLATFAVDDVDASYLTSALLHFAVAALLCWTVAIIACRRRLSTTCIPDVPLSPASR